MQNLKPKGRNDGHVFSFLKIVDKLISEGKKSDKIILLTSIVLLVEILGFSLLGRVYVGKLLKVGGQEGLSSPTPTTFEFSRLKDIYSKGITAYLFNEKVKRNCN